MIFAFEIFRMFKLNYRFEHELQKFEKYIKPSQKILEKRYVVDLWFIYADQIPKILDLMQKLQDQINSKILHINS